MNKKSLAILLIASSFASSAFANSIINKLIIKHSPVTSSIVKTHKMTKQTNRPYTNFSGTWMVNCGDAQSMLTVIENDAYFINFDGNASRIGQGLEGQSESNEEYTASGHSSYEWNEDGSALTIKSVNLFKSNTDNSAIETDISKYTLTMKNGQIILDGQGTLFEDLTQAGQPMTGHCVFTRKQ